MTLLDEIRAQKRADRRHCKRCGRLLSAERNEVFEGQRRVCECGEVWNVKEEVNWEAVNAAN